MPNTFIPVDKLNHTQTKNILVGLFDRKSDQVETIERIIWWIEKFLGDTGDEQGYVVMPKPRDDKFKNDDDVFVNAREFMKHIGVSANDFTKIEDSLKFYQGFLGRLREVLDGASGRGCI